MQLKPSHHEAPVKTIETKDEWILSGRYAWLGGISLICTIGLAFLLFYLESKQPPAPSFVRFGVLAMTLIFIYATFDNFRTSKSLRLHKLRRTYSFNFKSGKKQETTSGAIEDLIGPKVTTDEDDGTIYFNVDLIVPDANFGRFRLFRSSQDDLVLEQKKAWSLRLGMGSDETPNISVTPPQDDLSFLPVTLNGASFQLPESQRAAGSLMVVVGVIFLSLSIGGLISELGKSTGLSLVLTSLFFLGFFALGTMLAWGGILLGLTRQVLNFSRSGLRIQRRLHRPFPELVLSEKNCPWKELTTVDLIPRDSRGSLCLRIRMRSLRFTTTFEGTANQIHLPKLYHAIRRWAHAHGNFHLDRGRPESPL